MPFLLDDIRKDLTVKTAGEKIEAIKELEKEGKFEEALRKVAGLSEDDYIELPEEDVKYVIKLAADKVNKITDDEPEVDTSETEFGDISDGQGKSEGDLTETGPDKPKEPTEGEDLTEPGPDAKPKEPVEGEDLTEEPTDPPPKQRKDDISLSPDEKVAALLEAHGKGITKYYEKVAHGLRKRAEKKKAMLQEHEEAAKVLRKLAEEHGEEVITALASAAYMKGVRSAVKNGGQNGV